MRKNFLLSTICASLLMANSSYLGVVDVNATPENLNVNEVGTYEVESADVSTALTSLFPSISLVRRSAVANDIIIRGLKKDNLSVTIDDGKIYGACPNRMDPPISHIQGALIDNIQISEGPFDVATQGALGASVKVNTIEPKKGLSGFFNLEYGSFEYKKLSTLVNSSVGIVDFYVAAFTESAKQYKDGAGNDFVGQQKEYIKSHPTAAAMEYKEGYQNLDAYKKTTFATKANINISQNQKLSLSYTYNDTQDMLYPNTPMDADFDKSYLFNAKYIVKNLSKYSDKLIFEFYNSRVNHPMSNRYRNSSKKMGVIKHHLQDKVKGGAIRNFVKVNMHNLEMGIDYSQRNWDGKYYKNNNPFPADKLHSIYDVTTKDYGVYFKDNFKVNKLSVQSGLRYDYVKVTTPRETTPDRKFSGVSANVMLNYALNSNISLFTGLGSGIRVPDGKELYYYNKQGVLVGNPNLKKVRNYEIDLGAKVNYQNFNASIKTFYNYLKDDILYNATTKRYENVDAYIYGVELGTLYNFSDNLWVEANLAYLKGKKKDPLTNQSNKNLPEIPPLHFNASINYMPNSSLTLKAEFLASAAWSKYDKENGEQRIGGYGVLNFKAIKEFDNGLSLIFGVNNIFDKKYAVSNTYKDLTLITGGDETMLLNEPGRNFYAKVSWKF